jgi:hypothetical protein
MKNSRPSDVNEAINQALEVADQATGTAPVIDSPLVGAPGMSTSARVDVPERIHLLCSGGCGKGFDLPAAYIEITCAECCYKFAGERIRELDNSAQCTGDRAVVTSPAIPLESLAKYSDEGENGWNAWGRADIAKKMQRIAAGGYNSVDKLIELVEVGR